MRLGRIMILWGEIALFLLIFFSESGSPQIALVSAVLHEFAHLLTCVIVGGKPRSIAPKRTGFAISYSNCGISYTKELLIILSGPIFNIAVGAILAYTGHDSAANVNFGLGVINLLPLIGLDGAGALYTFCSGLAGERIASRIVRYVSTTVSVILWICTVWYELRYGTNLSLLAVSVYILLLGLTEKKDA